MENPLTLCLQVNHFGVGVGVIPVYTCMPGSRGPSGRGRGGLVAIFANPSIVSFDLPSDPVLSLATVCIPLSQYCYCLHIIVSPNLHRYLHDVGIPQLLWVEYLGVQCLFLLHDARIIFKCNEQHTVATLPPALALFSKT